MIPWYLLISSLFIPFKSPSPPDTPLTFHLRQAHAISNISHVVFQNVPPSLTAAASFNILAKPVNAHRPSSHPLFEGQYPEWDNVQVPGPDVESQETLLQLAKMTSNAYNTDLSGEWYDLGPGWNTVRGHFHSLILLTL